MKKNLVFAVIGAFSLVVPMVRSSAQAPVERDDPVALTQMLLQMEQFLKIDFLVKQMVDNKPRAEEGRYELFTYMMGLRTWFEAQGEERDLKWRRAFEKWATLAPDSAVEPAFRALQMSASAWNARGRGYNSTVSEEGRFLFRERAGRAWLMIRKAKPKGDKLPIWYELAISLGADAGVEDGVLRELFDEGISKFPGYHGIYFAYARGLAPIWGGDYADASSFINEQVAAPTNVEGDVLYARLFWLLDQYQNKPMEFFSESGVEWPKMRAGFERMMREYPKSARNQAFFAVYACRAGDNKTFRRLRKQLDVNEFSQASPHWLSLDICETQAK